MADLPSKARAVIIGGGGVPMVGGGNADQVDRLVFHRNLFQIALFKFNVVVAKFIRDHSFTRIGNPKHFVRHIYSEDFSCRSRFFRRYETVYSRPRAQVQNNFALTYPGYAYGASASVKALYYFRGYTTDGIFQNQYVWGVLEDL